MLVVAGLFILGNRLFPDLLPIMPLIIGLLFLGLFFVTRSVGAVVSGSILVGVGIGILVVKGSDPDVGTGGFLISLAGGFFLAWVLGLLFNIRSLRWWPLAPGLILLVIGAIVTSGHMGKDLVSAAADWWPALLVLMGAFLLYRARSHHHVSDETTAVPVVVHDGVARPVEIIEHDDHGHQSHEDHERTTRTTRTTTTTRPTRSTTRCSIRTPRTTTRRPSMPRRFRAPTRFDRRLTRWRTRPVAR